jgi:hypothetical protein
MKKSDLKDLSLGDLVIHNGKPMRVAWIDRLDCKVGLVERQHWSEGNAVRGINAQLSEVEWP